MTAEYPTLITIRCRHCGPVATTDRAVIRGTIDTVRALQQGYAPLGAMTCPLCRDEVRARDISSDICDDAGRAVAPTAGNVLPVREPGPWDTNGSQR